jgi:hypothetical protein
MLLLTVITSELHRGRWSWRKQTLPSRSDSVSIICGVSVSALDYFNAGQSVMQESQRDNGKLLLIELVTADEVSDFLQMKQ